MTPSLLFAAITLLLISLVWLTWLISGRSAELKRRLAVAEAGNEVLRGRLDDAVALFENRLLRLEGVKGAAGSRSKQRRQAAELLRQGADPVAVARRYSLPTAELQLLVQLDELTAGRRQSATS